MEIKTERLLLRQWLADDLPLFAQINSDPAVMEYYPTTMTEHESNVMANKFSDLISARGWGFWALECVQQKSFIGFVGLHRPTYELPVSDCVEIGWRLAKHAWGNGYATEAARAALDFAFKQLKLPQVYSFTSVSNQRSRAVMERLNMLNTQANFEHPMIPIQSPLRQHVLYKIDQQAWRDS